MRNELEQLAKRAHAADLFAVEALAEELRACTKRSLASGHLVQTASSLARAGLTPAEMEKLGVPTDLLACFPAWRRGSGDGFRAPRSKLAPAVRTAGTAIAGLRVQISTAPKSISISLALLRALIEVLDPETGLAVVVEPGANRDGLERLVQAFSGAKKRRILFAELPTSSVFAQDNARLALRDGHPVLHLPREFGVEGHRAKDGYDEEQAATVLQTPVVRSALHWQGGNLLQGEQTIFVGADSIRANMLLLGLTRDEVLSLFAAELGSDITILGEVIDAETDGESELDSGQAAFHIDLDVCLLGGQSWRETPVALISDTVRGLEAMPAVLAQESLFEGHFLPAPRIRALIENEYYEHGRDRHERLLGYAEALESQGYEVIGVPSLSVARDRNLFARFNLDFGYCNSLPGLHRGTPSLYYLPWGIPELDRQAEAQMRAAGAQPVPVTSTGDLANRLMLLKGGLHCFCGPWL